MSGYYDLTDNKTKVTNLQTMLRTVGNGIKDDDLKIPINGIFDNTTVNALNKYKQGIGKNPDGVYDYDTHKQLETDYNETRELYSNPTAVRPFPKGEYEIVPGEKSELVMISQIMLNSIRINYDIPYVPLSGQYGEETYLSVERFQKINLLESTGVIDRKTWDRLAEEFNLGVKTDS